METCRQHCHRFVLCVVAFLIVWSFSGGEAKAQTRQDSKGSAATAADADHNDPDDTKSFADVTKEQRDITLRGRTFTLHLYRPAVEQGRLIPALYACGDGGWRLLAPRTAEQLAHSGLAVVGIDTKAYLRTFATSAQPLTVEQMARDYAEFAVTARDYARVGQAEQVYVYGWSLGAGFAVAAGSVPALQNNWAGIIAIGLPPQNQLAAGVDGDEINLTLPQNRALGFRTESVMKQLAPLPLVMIESSNDAFSPPDVGHRLFTLAAEPKNYRQIEAHNHRFSGGRKEFYQALSEAVTWIKQARSSNGTAAPAAKN